MFTGIIEEVGQVSALRKAGEGFSLVVKAKRVKEDLRMGDSLSVNGACLTVTSLHERNIVEAEVMPETLRRTNLGGLSPGEKVNLERALTPTSRMGGHFVTGHIDGTGTLLQRREEGNALVIRFSCPPEVSRYLIIKGSVAVDGISLTVSKTNGDAFEVSLVPHTLGETTLGQKKVGDKVNLEGDLLGKYVEKYTNQVLDKRHTDNKREITTELLQEKGFR